MNELIKKFPELLKMLLSQISQSDFQINNEESKRAKDKLLSQLQTITDEISKLEGDQNFSEEQIKMFSELSEIIPQALKWTK